MTEALKSKMKCWEWTDWVAFSDLNYLLEHGLHWETKILANDISWLTRTSDVAGLSDFKKDNFHLRNSTWLFWTWLQEGMWSLQFGKKRWTNSVHSSSESNWTVPPPENKIPIFCRLKPSCQIPFMHAFSALHFTFKVIKVLSIDLNEPT